MLHSRALTHLRISRILFSHSRSFYFRCSKWYFGSGRGCFRCIFISSRVQNVVCIFAGDEPLPIIFTYHEFLSPSVLPVQVSALFSVGRGLFLQHKIENEIPRREVTLGCGRNQFRRYISQAGWWAGLTVYWVRYWVFCCIGWFARSGRGRLSLGFVKVCGKCAPSFEIKWFCWIGKYFCCVRPSTHVGGLENSYQVKVLGGRIQHTTPLQKLSDTICGLKRSRSSFSGSWKRQFWSLSASSVHSANAFCCKLTMDKSSLYLLLITIPVRKQRSSWLHIKTKIGLGQWQSSWSIPWYFSSNLSVLRASTLWVIASVLAFAHGGRNAALLPSLESYDTSNISFNLLRNQKPI